MATLQSLTVNDTANLTLPVGTSADRPTINATVVSFTTVGSTTWSAPTGVTQIEVLVVAGGGGGGSRHGGGGGAGGLIYNSRYPVTPGTSYTVVIGGGGAGAIADGSSTGSQGSNSQFDSLVAIGGGAGTSSSGGAPAGGGSGGGGRGNSVGLGGTGTAGQGNKGGDGSLQSAPQNPDGQGGGGGGAGGAGSTGLVGIATRGQGGPGLFFNISGSLVAYAGGGGAGATNDPTYTGGAAGGVGGGGNGNIGATSSDNATAGTANTGGGGGAGGHTGGTNYAGKSGGSGIVIIRYSFTAASTVPTAQTRFNSVTGKLETYGTNNNWNNQSIGNIETRGLVLYVDTLAYTSGTVWQDLSGNNNNMTIVGSPSYSADSGFTLPAAQTTQYIILNPFSAMPTREATFEMWVKTPGGSGIISYAQPAEDNNMLMFDTTNVSLYGPGGAVGSGVNIANNQWTHLVRTSSRISGEEKLYVNGQLRFQTVISAGTLFTAGGSLVLGQEQDAVGGGFDAGQSMAGSFAVVRVYSNALSNEEIIQNFNAESSRFYAPPVPSTPAIVTNGLTIHLDAQNPASFGNREGFTSTWFDLAGTHNGTTSGVTAGYGFVSNANNIASFAFDGVDDKITFANYLVPAVARSFFIWVKFSSLTHSSGYQLMGTQEGGAYTYIGIANGGNVYYYAGASTGSEISGTAVTVNTWVNLGFVLNIDGSRTVYRNGIPVLFTTGGLGNAATAAFTLGTINNNHWLNGNLAVALLYHRPLSQQEVTQNFAALRNRYGI